MRELLNQSYFGNALISYLIFVGIIILSFILIRLFKKIALNKLKKWASKTENDLDDFLVDTFESSILPIIKVGSIYLAFQFLNISLIVTKIVHASFIVVTAYYSILTITNILQHILETYVSKVGDKEERRKNVKGVMIILKICIWSLGFVFVLDNLGYDVTAIAAGLGIGGIAIALAAQAILGDLFSYFVIFFDRPFELGDFIIVDDKLGTVEYIGVKSTRIRSLSGEQLVISNTNLTNSRIHNFKKMERRRVLFTLGVTYQTPKFKLEKIPGIIKSIIENRDNVTFDRAHFAKFNDFSLDFEIVYYIQGADYNLYMDIQQTINLAIYAAFEEENIDFAYPTQSLFIQKSND